MTLQTRPDFRILGVLETASVRTGEKHTTALPLRYGVSFFVIYSINHPQEAVVGSRAKTLTLVVVCQRCELPTIAFLRFKEGL